MIISTAEKYLKCDSHFRYVQGYTEKRHQYKPKKIKFTESVKQFTKEKIQEERIKNKAAKNHTNDEGLIDVHYVAKLYVARNI